MQNLLKKYQLRPSKKLGQNFLIDKGAIKKVIKTTDLKTKDVILEIGPGLGVLTKELVKKARKVMAVEKDSKMVEILKETLRNFNNVKIVQGDILKFRIQIPKQYKVVGNLPFYLTAPVIRKFLEAKKPPKEMILIVQKEVGQRICARPPDMNLLAVSVQFYAKPEIISYVSKKSFWPQPKVDGMILRIAPLINARRKLINTDLFFKIVKAGFSQPRKQLINNLSKGLKTSREKVKNWLLKNRVQPERRAETLSVGDWMLLTKSLPRYGR